MSVNTTTNKISHTGNGVSTVFPYDFKILDASHLFVYIDGMVKSYLDGYIVTGAGDATGGSVVFTSAPLAGAFIVLLRNVPLTQPVSTVDNSTILQSVLDTALDRETMQIQQVAAQALNSLRANDADPASPSLVLPLAADRANKYLRFDANGTPSTVDSQIISVYYGPLTLDPTTRPDGTAMVIGDLYYNTTTLAMRVYSGASWQNALPSATLSLGNFTETAATAKTTFTVPGGYTIGSTFVYLNGSLLYPSEYTAANGSTIVLAAACAIGDEFRAVSYSSFSVADTLSRSSNLNDLPSKPTAIVNLGIIATATELNQMVGVTSPVQTQINTKLSKTSDDTLGGGYTATADNDGAFSSGSYTPTPAGGNYKRITCGGAFAIVAPTAAGDYMLAIQVTNTAGAGAITLSGFSKTFGDLFTTTVGDDFFISILKLNGFTSATVQALQ